MESSSDLKNIENEILRVKKQYTSMYELFVSGKNLVGYNTFLEIKTNFDNASKNIVQAQKEISEGKNGLARLELHSAEAHLQNAQKKIKGRAQRPVI